MRPLAVILFALAVLGSLFGYLKIAERTIEAPEFEAVDAEGQFSVVLTLPFDAVGSDFDINEESESLSLQLDGKTIFKKTESVPRGELTIENVEGLKMGRNEFVVSAQPIDSTDSSGFSLDNAPAETTPLPVPIRIQVYRDGILIGEKTSWNQAGLRLVASMIVDIKSEFEAD